MHIILVGDMYQLPPVRQAFLPKVVTQIECKQLGDLSELERQKYAMVAEKFLELKRYQFTRQMRSQDETHTTHLATMRSPSAFVDTSFLSDYQMLRPGDFRERRWRMCHIGVRTNQERVALTVARAPAMAKELGTCVVRWFNDFRDGRLEISDFEQQKMLFVHGVESVASMYVFRGACMLLDNINPAKQLANGTRGQFWGLVWETPFDLVPGGNPPWRFREGGSPMSVHDFDGIEPGDEVWVPQPKFVVMRYKQANGENEIVAVGRKPEVPRDTKWKGKSLSMSIIPVEPAWVCTFHKLQGLTYRESDDVGLVLCLLGCKKAPSAAAMVLVAFSRVVARNMLRLAPCGWDELHSELQGLLHSSDVLDWDANYDAEGHWMVGTFEARVLDERREKCSSLTEQDLSKMTVPSLRYWYRCAFGATPSHLKKAELLAALLAKVREWRVQSTSSSSSSSAALRSRRRSRATSRGRSTGSMGPPAPRPPRSSSSL
jgi:hypothetical protein